MTSCMATQPMQSCSPVIHGCMLHLISQKTFGLPKGAKEHFFKHQVPATCLISI